MKLVKLENLETRLASNIVMNVKDLETNSTE